MVPHLLGILASIKRLETGWTIRRRRIRRLPRQAIMTPDRISPALSRDRREDGQDGRRATPPLPEHAGRAARGASPVAGAPASACIFTSGVSTVTSGKARGFAG